MLVVAPRDGNCRPKDVGLDPMLRRLVLLLLAVLLASGSAGCAHDPFARCDQRKSLADWFDMYGPTGCNCRNHHCSHR
jgi:hypothetical protein